MFLKIDEGNLPVATFFDEGGDVADGVVEMMGCKGDADVFGGIQFIEVSNRIWRGEHRILMVFDGHGDAQFLGEFVVWFQFFKEGLHLSLRFHSDGVFRSHPSGSADGHPSSVLPGPSHLIVLPEWPERIASRNRHLGLMFLEEFLEGLVTDLTNLLAMCGMHFSPNVNGRASRLSYLFQDYFKRHVAIHRRRQDVAGSPLFVRTLS